MDTSPENTEDGMLTEEIACLRLEIERYRERERDLEESRRAMLYMLEDLNESSDIIDRARKEWEATFDGISGPVFIHDSELKVLRANKAYVREAGIPLEDIVGRPYYEIFPSRAIPHGSCREAMKTGDDKEEVVHDGSGRIFDVHFYPISDETGRYLYSVHIMEDITERKKAEEDRIRLEEQLRQAQKMEAVGTLAGGIAHDFNNILNVIMGFGSLAQSKMEQGHPSKEHLNEVLTAAERAASLTQRLLLFSRRQSAEMKPVDVNDVITGLQKMLTRIIGEDIDFETSLAKEKLPIMADAGQIEQVLMNLAANARDAMPKGGRLTIGTGLTELDEEFIIAHGYGEPGRYALVTVSDTGSGMDAGTLGKIFEPFFTTKDVGQGTGLGLSLAYGIVKQHRGYINVYSEVEKGTTFRIMIPLMQGTEEPAREDEPFSAPAAGTETILVAEDDASLRRLARIILETFGYKVITAEDGEDAIEKFRENRDRIDLLLLDMIMPRRNGREVYDEIRKTDPDIKTLFMSGYTRDVINDRDMIKGVLDFITKPVLPKDLLKKVRERLDK